MAQEYLHQKILTGTNNSIRKAEKTLNHLESELFSYQYKLKRLENGYK